MIFSPSPGLPAVLIFWTAVALALLGVPFLPVGLKLNSRENYLDFVERHHTSAVPFRHKP